MLDPGISSSRAGRILATRGGSIVATRTVRIVATLAAIVLASLVGGWLLLRAGLPQTTGTIQVEGLDAAVAIVRDADGVPHIRATSDADAFFALGFVHAQDRLWQMEFQRRVGAGRMSEIVGESALATDKFLRTLGTYRAAEVALAQVSPRSRAVLDAYVAGVNAYLAQDPWLPPEFAILGFRPEPWTPVDSLVWAKMMAWDLGGNWDEDLLRLRVAQAVGPERAAVLMPSFPQDGETILGADLDSAIDVEAWPAIGDDGPLASMADDLLALDDRLQQAFHLGGRDIGSNNWVVSGRLTASGHPLLANDPHLNARIPSAWYLAEIRGDRLHVAGATLPGLPGVLVGRNEDIAWGATNLGPDVQDLYVERLNPADPNQYAVGDTWTDLTIVEEPIRVKDRDVPIPWAARATRHGPLISDASDKPGQPLALRWTALDAQDTTLDAFLGVQYAADWDEFLAALRLLGAPGQNFVYADRAGNIGYTATGRIPIRPGGDSGRLPVPGWDAGHEWSGWIPWEELPRAYNPPTGIIVTANNRAVPDDYPYYITHDWAPPYRAARIAEMIAAKVDAGAPLTADDMVAIQADQTSAQARELAPLLLRTAPADPRQEQAMAVLRGWDGDLGAESTAAAIYEAWFLALGEALFADDLSGSLYTTLAERTHPLFVADVVARMDATWCDDVLSAPREDCDDTVRSALDTALDALEERLGDDMSRWQWGDAHAIQYSHAIFSDVWFLRPFFHRSIPNGGDTFTVNVATVRLAARYEQYRAPSYRQVIDLGDMQGGSEDAGVGAGIDEGGAGSGGGGTTGRGKSRFIQNTGQSGNPMSRHYDDFIARHQAVAYVPLRFGEEVEGGERLELRGR